MSKIRILLIDDEEDFLIILKKKLESEGYEVLTATNGKEGIEKTEAGKPDMVICDWMMPEKNGFEVLKELKERGSLRVPFVMLTAMDDFDKVKKAYASDADFYVPKSIDLDKLVDKIRTLLNLSKDRIW